MANVEEDYQAVSDHWEEGLDRIRKGSNGGDRYMSKPQASNHRVSVKVAERQYEFLEDRAKELGLSSKAELLRWYITTDMAKTIEIERFEGKSKKERVFLEGVISDGRVTESDIEEVEKEWEMPGSL